MKNEDNKDLTSETVVIKVSNTEKESSAPEIMKSPEEIIKVSNIKETETMEVNAKLINDGTTFTTKSQQEGQRFSGTLSYEDVLSNTRELIDIKKTDIDYLKEDSKLRREKIENLDEHLKDLNAQPLSSVDSYSNYNLVLNKSVWNYNEVEQRKTKLQLIDLALQTHIYIYDGVIIPLNEVQSTILNFISAVKTNIVSGYPVILNSALIVDVLRFDKSKIIPITIANPKLMPPIGVIEWQSFVPEKDNNHLIIEAFIKLLDNALSNGHECEFFHDTIMVRNASGITSLFISEAAAAAFNASLKPTSSKNQ